MRERDRKKKRANFLIVAHLYCCIYRPGTRIQLWHLVECSNLDLMQLFVVFVDNIYGDGNKPYTWKRESHTIFMDYYMRWRADFPSR